MSVPFIDFSQQHKTIAKEVDRGFKEVFRRADFILGKEAEDFERNFAHYCESQHGVGVNSGTDALYIALSALDLKAGDEVVVPTFTYIATALCVSYVGVNLVFADIEPETYNIDPKSFEKVITKKTKAVIPVHIYGQPADMDAISKISRRHGIKIIEDAAQAHGSSYQGKRVGSLGDAACFSFYPTKGLGGYGDGGMIVTKSKKIADMSRKLRDYGRRSRYEHELKGHNSRLDTLQAVVLNAKLKHLDAWNGMRQQVAAWYGECLKGTNGVALPIVKSGRTHVYQTFAVRLKNRKRVMEALKAQGISALIHYPIPIHLQEAYKELKHKRGDFPVAEMICNEILSLPMFPHMTKAQVKSVCDAIKESA